MGKTQHLNANGLKSGGEVLNEILKPRPQSIGAEGRISNNVFGKFVCLARISTNVFGHFVYIVSHRGLNRALCNTTEKENQSYLNNL
jgi:hypothetical protein